MNSIVIYSSRTGNTKQVAEAIVGVLPEGTPCVPVNEAPADLSQYDLVFMGFWADQGNADKVAQAVLKRIDNEKVALFATLGVPPMMPHAKETMVAATGLLPKGQEPIGTFMCQGKVDPKVIEMMFKIFPDGHPHDAIRNVKNAINRRHLIRMLMTWPMQPHLLKTFWPN